MITFENCSFIKTGNGGHIIRAASSTKLKNCTVQYKGTGTGRAVMVIGDKVNASSDFTVEIDHSTIEYNGSYAVVEAHANSKASPTIKITNSTLTATAETMQFGVVICPIKATVLIGGDQTKVELKAKKNAIEVHNGATLTIDGGSYTGAGPVVLTKSANAIVKAGTFTTTATGNATTVFQATAVSDIQLCDGIVVDGGDRIYHAGGKAQISLQSGEVARSCQVDRSEVPYPCMTACKVALPDEELLLTDYASAGRLWSKKSESAAWIPAEFTS